MKIHGSVLRFVLVLSALAFLSECGWLTPADKEKTPDPEGTVEVNINTTVNGTPVVLYSGPIDEGDYCCSGQEFDAQETVEVFFGVDKNINFHITHHYGDASNWGWFQNEGGELADLGKVSGLGDVTDIPETGWATTIAATKGHGYVLRYKHSINMNDDSFPMHYATIYVEDYLMGSISGGVIGIKMKYKNPM